MLSPLPKNQNSIQILDHLVAERIAAGEVIERPSSIVKELVENSIDAGASEIAVTLEDGGKRLIEVLDNGHGMDEEAIKLCSLRHATSKIRSVEDLETLSSLGFRGEALPSIAAVSQLSILSRARYAKDSEHTSDAWEWSDGKTLKATFGHFLGAHHGTRILAQGLFSQIPARLKFLKSSGTEVSHVREWMERLALTHPEIGFKLTHENKVILNFRASTMEERVRQILGDGNDYPLVSHTREEISGIRVTAYWLQGLSSPQTRKLIQIINQRAVRDRLVQQAMLSAFRQALLPGQFPALALVLDLPPHLVDVNVHPTKTELRFLNSSQVFRAVQVTLEELVSKNGVTGFAPSTTYQASETPRTESLWSSHFSFPPSSPVGSWKEPPISQKTDQTPEEPLHPFQGHRFSGILFQTYLLYDLGNELALVDQHAAHERIRYEMLKARALKAQGRSCQQLLMPESVQFPSERRRDLESRLSLLIQLGFEAEVFGENQLLFRGIPPEWGNANLKTRLMTLVEKLMHLEDLPDASSVTIDERMFEKLASEACHSAVRAGDRLDPSVAQALVNQLFECEHPWNCPHGRPTIARVPRARFEEWFQRKV